MLFRNSAIEPVLHLTPPSCVSIEWHANSASGDDLGSELPQESHQDLLELLFRTYPLYVDRPSRYAVQQCLRSLLKAPAPADDVKFLIQKLKTETSKAGLAAASAFVLVEWCSVLLQHLKEDPNTPLGTMLDLITVDAKALDLCFGASPKSTVGQSALRVTRRALRAVFSSETWGEDAVRQSIIRLTSDAASGQKNTPFLGVISGVCARLPAKKPVAEEQKKAIIAFYVKELIGSRSAVPPHISNGLSDFFASFVTYEDVETELIPPMEKAVLRAPEVVLGGLIPALCSSLPEQFDLSELLLSRLLKHLISSMKSNNPAIRHGAISSFESLLAKSKAEGSLLKITSEVVAPLKTQKVTSPEHRAVFAQSLTAILPSVALSQEVVQGLIPVFSRESTEPALEQEIGAFCKHLTFLVQSKVKVSGDAINTIVKGSSDKRVPFRKLWQLNVGEVLWETDSAAQASPEVEPLATKFINNMKGMFNEVASNPLPSAQNGALSTSYVYLALLKQASTIQGADTGDWQTTVAQSMVLAPKPSFLLNPRAYVKLVSQSEIQWAVRALAAVASSSKFEAAEHAAKIAWAQAFIYAITAPGLHTNFREQSARALSDVHINNPGSFGRIVVDALWAWILAFRTSEKESALVSAGPSGESLLNLVAKSICPPASSLQEGSPSGLKNQLIELLVLCRPELIPNAAWIALCLRTGTDPGNLVREHPGECMKQLTRVQEVCKTLKINYVETGTNLSQDPVQSKIPQIDAAIWSAAADLAFVAPDSMIPQLIDQIKDDLNAERMSRFTPTDAAIARTPEGTMFVDVLSNKKPAFDRNTKDYDTLKWEEELRAQLAEKKGQKEKKLSPDEHAKVKAQLATESKIRGEVFYEVKRVERGAGIIQGLANGPGTDAAGWINPAVSSLLGLMEAGAGLFVGDVVSKAYVSCADKLSTRLDPLRPFVGVATLRAIGRTYLPPELEVEPLGGKFC